MEEQRRQQEQPQLEQPQLEQPQQEQDCPHQIFDLEIGWARILRLMLGKRMTPRGVHLKNNQHNKQFWLIQTVWIQMMWCWQQFTTPQKISHNNNNDTNNEEFDFFCVNC